MSWRSFFAKSREISKAVFIAGKFSAGETIPWEALRVILALKFAVLPKEIDKLEFKEITEILGVLDGQSKASSGSSGVEGR